MEVPAAAAAAVPATVSSDDGVDTLPPPPVIDEGEEFKWLEEPCVKSVLGSCTRDFEYMTDLDYAGANISLIRNFVLPSEYTRRNFKRDFISAAENAGKTPKGWFRHKTYDPIQYVLQNLKVKFASGTPVTPTVVVQFDTSHSVVFRRRPTEAERLVAATRKYDVA